MRRGQRVLCLLATITLLSCGRLGSTGASSNAIHKALAAKPHRLGVVFWPQLSGCGSCDRMIGHVISEWQSDPGAQTAVVSVIPADAVNARLTRLPGAVVRLGTAEYERLAGSAPRPRVEIWSASGELLLSRSIPNYGSQAELLTEEMLAARSFTAPVVIASRRQP